MTEREKEILAIIRDNPTISQEELAFELGISRSGVAAHIHNLMKKGYIKGKGYIVNNPSFVTVIGGINMDIVAVPKEKVIVNNSNPGKINYYFGGAGRNMALALTKLGISTNLISVYGDDVNGDRFVLEARRQGLSIDCCEKISGFNTSTFVYLEDYTSDFRVGLDDMRILENISPELINRYLQRINQSKYCVIDDNLPEETIKHLSEYVDVPIIAKSVSINKVLRLIPILSKLELLVLSDLELEALACHFDSALTTMKKQAEKILAIGVKSLLIVEKSGDVSYWEVDNVYKIKKCLTPEFNSNGSTAVFTSSLIWGILQDKYLTKDLVELGYSGATTSFLTNDSVFEGLSPELILERYQKYFLN